MTTARKPRPMLITEVMEMRRLYEQEFRSVSQIAEIMGRVSSTVHRALRSAGVTMRPVGTMTYRHPTALSNEQIEAAVELYKPGVSIGDVADQLGLTWSAARLRLSYAGAIRSRSETLRMSSKVKRLSPEVENRIVELYTSGGTCLSVSSEVGVSPASVSSVLARRGVAANKQRGGRRRMKPREMPKPVDLERVSSVDAAPLAAALLVQIRHREMFSLDGEGRKEVCARAGIDARQLFAWQSGEIRKTHFDVADRVLTRTGKLWWTVYDPQAYGPGLFADRQRDDVLRWMDSVDHAARMWEGEPAFGAR